VRTFRWSFPSPSLAGGLGDVAAVTDGYEKGLALDYPTGADRPPIFCPTHPTTGGRIRRSAVCNVRIQLGRHRGEEATSRAFPAWLRVLAFRLGHAGWWRSLGRYQ
jgi:hypothetical protein